MKFFNFTVALLFVLLNISFNSFAQFTTFEVEQIKSTSKKEIFKFTSNADTAFVIGKYMYQHKHPFLTEFLEVSIQKAQQTGNELGLVRLKALRSQSSTDNAGAEKANNARNKVVENNKRNKVKTSETKPQRSASSNSPDLINKKSDNSGIQKAKEANHELKTNEQLVNKTENEELSPEELGDFYSKSKNAIPSLAVENYLLAEKEAEASEDKEKLKDLREKLAHAYIKNKEPEKARKIHEDFIANAENIQKKMQAYSEAGNFFFGYDLYEDALDFREDWLDEAEKVKSDTCFIDAKNGIGEIFQIVGITQQSLENHLEALKRSEKIDDKKRQVDSYTGMAILNLSVKEFEEAHKTFKKGFKIAKENKLLKEQARIHSNRAKLYLEEKKPSKAIKDIENCNEICDQLNAVDDIIRNLNLIGDINTDYKYLNNAQISYQSSHDRSLDLSKQSFQAMNYADIGKLLTIENKYEAAIDSCKKGYEIAKEIKHIELLGNNCQCLHQAYKSVGNFEEGLKYHEENKAIQDTLFNAAKLKQISKLQAFYTYEKEMLNKDHSINILQEKGKQRTAQLGFLGLLALSLLGGIIFTYRNLRWKSRNNKKLSELNLQLEDSNKQLGSANFQLEDVNKQLKVINKDYENANQKLKEANVSLENFASVAAHDLKAPLRSISSFSDLLMRKNKDRLDETDLEYFQFINNDADRLQKMINALLKFSKIDKNLPASENVNLNEIVEKVKNSLASVVLEKNAKIEVDKLTSVKGHPELIAQLFQNFIGNSLKFQKPGITPSIKIIGEPAEEKGYYRINITDNGIGISDENIPKLFELFRRFNPSSKYEGSGIGLATCKRIIDHYEGETFIESEEGYGSTFSFTLPVGEPKTKLVKLTPADNIRELKTKDY